MSDFSQGATDTRQVVPSRRIEEVWESNIQGRVWVEGTDHRGAPRMLTTYGVGQRLRITAEDRVLAQEKVRDAQDDPFVNGMLRRIDADQSTDPSTDSPDALSDDDLKLVFGLDEHDFIEEINKFGQVTHRRMKDMAPAHATVVQAQILDDLIKERYPLGGESPSWPGPSNNG